NKSHNQTTKNTQQSPRPSVFHRKLSEHSIDRLRVRSSCFSLYTHGFNDGNPQNGLFNAGVAVMALEACMRNTEHRSVLSLMTVLFLALLTVSTAAWAQ